MTAPATTAGPSYSELVAAIRSEGEGILAAAGLGLDVWVPTCREWNVEELVRHVSRVYAYVADVVGSRATAARTGAPPMPDGAPLDVLREVLDELVGVLSEADGDTPVWTWAPGEPDVAHFWARRMAHESTIHRYDAQIAHAMAQPIDAGLASDGLDELVDVLAAAVYRRDEVTDGPAGTVALHASDGGAWWLELTPTGVMRGDVGREPTASASGTVSTLLLAASSRVPWTSLELTGDAALLEAWSETLSF